MRRIATLIIVLCLTAASAQKHTLYIGTYTNSCQSKGIYTYEFDTETGQAKYKLATDNVKNPSYLAQYGTFLYAVNESGKESTLTAFSIADGKLRQIDQQPTKGADPCYVSATGNHVFTANYSGGSITQFDREADGKFGKRKVVIEHQGSSTNRDRQNSPHPHMVILSPEGQLFVPDLGTDTVYVYELNKNGDQSLTRVDEIPVKPGSGPRHLRFATKNRFYLLQELDGTLSTYERVDGKWTLKAENSIVSNPAHQNSAAHIELSADGKFLYATNRGDSNTISTFEISADGKLKPVETIPTGGIGPRNFTIDPSGKFLLVAHQYSNDVIIFKRDLKTGKLTKTDNNIILCSPVCLLFSE